MGAWTPANPFEGSGLNLYQFASDTPVDVNRLQTDIATVSGVTEADLMVSSAVANIDGPVSDANPLTIFVASQVPLKKKDIQSIIDGHVPDPPEVVATDPSGVQIISDDPTMPDVLDKLRSGKSLTTKELSLVLKNIVGS